MSRLEKVCGFILVAITVLAILTVRLPIAAAPISHLPDIGAASEAVPEISLTLPSSTTPWLGAYRGGLMWSPKSSYLVSTHQPIITPFGTRWVISFVP